MKEWCLGFVFTDDCTKVLLLKKSRTMHIGQWNGVGGKIEKNETTIMAMTRECKEEANLDISDWKFVGHLQGISGGEKWTVHIFASEISLSKMDEVTADWSANAKADTPYKFRIEELGFMNLAPHTEVMAFAAKSKLQHPHLKPLTMMEVD